MGRPVHFTEHMFFCCHCQFVQRNSGRTEWSCHCIWRHHYWWRRSSGETRQQSYSSDHIPSDPSTSHNAPRTCAPASAADILFASIECRRGHVVRSDGTLDTVSDAAFDYTCGDFDVVPADGLTLWVSKPRRMTVKGGTWLRSRPSSTVYSAYTHAHNLCRQQS